MKGVGPKTVRALALVGEVIYGAAPSYEDPARYSFAHGGKDATPYPVDRVTYDQTIADARVRGPENEVVAGRERKSSGKIVESASQYVIIFHMTTLIHADIFFFVTTIAVAVITIALTVLIVYLVKVFRSVRKIADAVSDETVLLRHDISDLRSEIRARGARAAGAFDWFERSFGDGGEIKVEKEN